MTKTIIGIVEDEVVIADNLQQLLLQLGYAVPEPVATYAEALEMVAEEMPDLLLLDIQIKGKKDGIELAAKLRERQGPPVIFLTANADAQTVQRAKAVEPAAYLIKPFTRDDLYAAIEVAMYKTSTPTGSQAQSPPQALFIKEGQAFQKVAFADVLYLESEHVYVQIHTQKRKFLVRSSMQDYLSHFDPKLFFRIHRSYVINLAQIDSTTADYVIVGGHKLPVGKSYQDELFKRLGIR